MSAVPVHVLTASVSAVGLAGPVARFAIPRATGDAQALGDFLPARMRRGTSVLTRLLVDVSAAVAPALSLEGLCFVFGSAWGEVSTAAALLEMRHRADGQLSPARFGHSVHNTAAGLMSIATSNRVPSTAIAAGADTVAMCLLEAMGWLTESAVPVLLAVAEETPPVLLAPELQHAPFAAAFLLSRTARPGESLGTLGLVRRLPNAPAETFPPGLVGCPAACALPLLRALATRTPGTVALGDHAAPYGVDVAFAESE